MPLHCNFALSRKTRKYLRAVTGMIDDTMANKVDGFKSVHKRALVYCNVTLGLILKQPNFIMTPTTPLRVRIPTIYLGDGWYVQPLAERKNTSEACRLIRAQLGNFCTDLHRYNVGWWNGKPVMFDW